MFFFIKKTTILCGVFCPSVNATLGKFLSKFVIKLNRNLKRTKLYSKQKLEELICIM